MIKGITRDRQPIVDNRAIIRGERFNEEAAKRGKGAGDRLFTGVVNVIYDARIVDGKLVCSYSSLSFHDGVLADVDSAKTVSEDK